MGHYLDLARTATTSSFCPDRSYEINELNEKSPLETHGQILRAVLLVVPDGVPEEWVQGCLRPHGDAAQRGLERG